MNKRKILIADDSAIILKTLDFRLKSAGYDTLTASDPSEALAKIRAEHPDVIIMDINFPPDVGFGGGGTWDGFRIFEWMNLNHTRGDAKLFIITSEEIEKHRAKARAAGVEDLFQKPIDAKALLNRIRECLGETPVVTT